MQWSLFLSGLLAVSGCTFTAGDWFANLRPSFEAQYALRADRDVGGGWQKLNTLYQARMTRALVTVESVQLQDLGGDGSAVGFDPANPPPGYSLCHNGHCHHDDGRLVPYAEIAAEIAGGGTSAVRTVVSFPVGEEDLLAPMRRELPCEPGCGIEEAHIRRVRATLTRVVFEGFVRDGRSPARFEGEVAWKWEIALAAGTGLPPSIVDSEIDLPADAAHPPDVTLELTLQTSARLLDDIEWASLTRENNAIDLAAALNVAARDQLQKNVAESELETNIKRSN